MYLLDTDWIIQALGGREPAVSILRTLAGGRVYVSVITLGEIYERAYLSPNPEAHLSSFRRFLVPYQVITVDAMIMERFAETRSFLRRQGQLIADFDLLIAATALHYELRS